MIVYTAMIGTCEDVRPLGHWTTPEARDAALLELLKSKGVDGPVDCVVLEVTGDPQVIVLVDDDERLVGGPFATPAEARELFPDEEAHTAEWSIDRYARALRDRGVEQAVADLSRRIVAELDAEYGTTSVATLAACVRAELPVEHRGGA